MIKSEDAKYLKEGIMFLSGYLIATIGSFMAFGPVSAGLGLILLGMLFIITALKGAVDKDKTEVANSLAASVQRS